MTSHVIRKIKKQIEAVLARKKSVLLLGPRQTGKNILQIKATLSVEFLTGKNLQKISMQFLGKNSL